MNLRHYLARSVSRPWPARRGRHRGAAPYRPSLEVLEGRVLPAAVTWINPAGGDWDTAANWSTGALPTAADDVQINTSAITIAHSLGNTDRVHSLISKSAISISAGALSLASASTLSSALTLSGGTLIAGLRSKSVAGYRISALSERVNGPPSISPTLYSVENCPRPVSPATQS